MDTGEATVDCLVVGGGPAGLSAAIYLGRLCRSVLVVDDRSGRSLWSQVNRNYLGFPDGIDAVDLRQLGREQAARYGTRFLAGSVIDVGGTEDGFQARLAPPERGGSGTDENEADDLEHGAALGERSVAVERTLRARTVVLATGVEDRFPTFPGSDECVGRTVFWCLICDGYEARGKQVVVVGEGDDAAETALQLREMDARVTLVAGSDAFRIDDDRAGLLAAAGIATHASAVAEYDAHDGCVRSLRLEADGSVLPLEALFVLRPARPRSRIAASLGARIDENGYVVADREQKTDVPGLFAAGDVTRAHNHQVSSAVHEGGMAAAAANYLLHERWCEGLPGRT